MDIGCVEGELAEKIHVQRSLGEVQGGGFAAAAIRRCLWRFTRAAPQPVALDIAAAHASANSAVSRVCEGPQMDAANDTTALSGARGRRQTLCSAARTPTISHFGMRPPRSEQS